MRSQGPGVKCAGETEIMSWLLQRFGQPDPAGVEDIKEFSDLVQSRQASLNIASADGATALHLAMREPRPKTLSRSTQSQIISVLLNAGACLYLTDSNGKTPLSQLQDGDHQEFVYGVVLQYRLDLEPDIPSAAPVSASRMLKGGTAGGQAAFSCVCEKVLYFVNEGGLWVWDVEGDEEYQVYVPGEEYTALVMLRVRLQMTKSQRSIAEYNRSSEVAELLELEANLEEQIADYEKDVAKVSGFCNFAAPIRKRETIPQRTEWILCNTGLLIEVTISEKGLVVRPPPEVANLESALLEVEAAGAAAEITLSPTIIRSINVNNSGTPTQGPLSARPAVPISLHVSSNRGSRMPRTPNPADGRRGLDADEEEKRPVTAPAPVGYAPSPTDPPTDWARGTWTPAYNQISSPHDYRGVNWTPVQYNLPGPGFNIERSLSGGDLRASFDQGAVAAISPPYEGVGRRYSKRASSVRRQSVKMLKKETEMGFLVGERGINVGCYCDALLGCLLTTTPGIGGGLVLNVYRLPLTAKTRFNEMITKIMDEEWVAAACLHTAFEIPENSATVVTVAKCGRSRYIFFTSLYPVAYDLPSDRFVSLKGELSPQGRVHAACATDNQPHRMIHPGKVRSLFAQVSDVVEVCELTDDLTVRPVYKVPVDRHEDQRYQICFHPAEDTLALLRAGRSQELCIVDLVTHTARSVCRLPRPSTLVFSGGQVGNKVPDFFLSFSRTGEYLLRYNTTMHVLSTYNWAEVLEDSHESAGYHNVTFCRAPLKVETVAEVQAREKAKLQAAFSGLVLCEVANASRTRRDLGSHWEATLSRARTVLRRVARAHLGDVADWRDKSLGRFTFPTPVGALNFALGAQMALYAEKWPAEVMEAEACREVSGIQRGPRVKIALCFATPVIQQEPSPVHAPPRADVAEGLLKVCPPGCIALTRVERLACAPYGSDFFVSPTAETFAGTFGLSEDVTSARVWLIAPDAFSRRLPGKQGKAGRVGVHNKPDPLSRAELMGPRQSVVSVLRNRTSCAGTVLWRNSRVSEDDLPTQTTEPADNLMCFTP
eukprot:Hpha_TRINITY_DN16524_c0_g1::TRINITY_DN16524_c0_g1_i1::g.133757::m.133757